MHQLNFREFPFSRDLAKVSKQFFGALTYLLKDLDIDRYFAIMIAIEDMDDKATQQALADKMRIDKVYMVKVMNYLTNKGYITKTRNKTDRREYIIKLTPKGKKTMPVIRAAINQLNQKMSKGIEKKEMETLYELLNKIYENLQELPIEKVFLRLRKRKTRG